VLGGFLPYKTQPLWANIYWTSLSLADPLTIVLLILNINIGLLAYALVIISDVIINLYFTISEKGILGIFNVFILGQLGCMFFYICTIKKVKAAIKTIKTK